MNEINPMARSSNSPVKKPNEEPIITSDKWWAWKYIRPKQQRNTGTTLIIILSLLMIYKVVENAAAPTASPDGNDWNAVSPVFNIVCSDGSSLFTCFISGIHINGLILRDVIFNEWQNTSAIHQLHTTKQAEEYPDFMNNLVNRGGPKTRNGSKGLVAK
eukprot:CAMPEP_0204845578 /NCGR_PEP_ID=MMETSP1347-20130617/1286_1 /ASSEMBLY_ACC=CAM_ASM_000690 /TAXON_ID=215587 /ORGANISM="Aplanochytrium stocchinoi, Strain GSBS06" /LENGTH=158 /DNA_ID=CAMNT_0051985715 /DNA_START=448 /DNA_END=924 /DNA_ORIENTATION=+